MHEKDPTHEITQIGDLDAAPPKIRLSTRGDLVASVPALLGFHPQRSLVVVFLDDRSHIACTMRADLDDALDHGGDILRRVTEAARTANADTVVILWFAPRVSGSLPWGQEVDAVITVLEGSGLVVADALLVDRGRYWSYLCHDEQCCPFQGTPVPQGTTQLEVQRVVQGRHAVVPDREAAISLYRPRPDLAPHASVYSGQEQVHTWPLADRCHQALHDVRALQEIWCSQGQRPTQNQAGDELRALLGLLLTDVTVRDYLLGTLAVEQSDLTNVTSVLTWLALTSTDDLRPALAATAAVLVALNGDDPAAFWALIDLAEGQSLAWLLAQGLQIWTPQTLRDLFVEALPDVQARIDAA